MASGLSIGFSIGLGGVGAVALGALADAVDLRAPRCGHDRADPALLAVLLGSRLPSSRRLRRATVSTDERALVAEPGTSSRPLEARADPARIDGIDLLLPLRDRGRGAVARPRSRPARFASPKGTQRPTSRSRPRPRRSTGDSRHRATAKPGHGLHDRPAEDQRRHRRGAQAAEAFRLRLSRGPDFQSWLRCARKAECRSATRRPRRGRLPGRGPRGRWPRTTPAAGSPSSSPRARQSGWRAATRSPSATSTRSTVPGIGAVIAVCSPDSGAAASAASTSGGAARGQAGEVEPERRAPRWG